MVRRLPRAGNLPPSRQHRSHQHEAEQRGPDDDLQSVLDTDAFDRSIADERLEAGSQVAQHDLIPFGFNGHVLRANQIRANLDVAGVIAANDHIPSIPKGKRAEKSTRTRTDL